MDQLLGTGVESFVQTTNVIEILEVLLGSGSGGNDDLCFPLNFLLHYPPPLKIPVSRLRMTGNKAGYTATPVACGWAGAIIEITPSFGQER